MNHIVAFFNVFDDFVLAFFRHSILQTTVDKARVVYFRPCIVEDLRFKKALLIIIATFSHNR